MARSTEGLYAATWYIQREATVATLDVERLARAIANATSKFDPHAWRLRAQRIAVEYARLAGEEESA